MGRTCAWRKTASMGPQPWELQKLSGGVQEVPGVWVLQWGRSLGSCGNHSHLYLRPKPFDLTIEQLQSLYLHHER